MTKINCDSPIHKVSSLILAFIILSLCVLPSFASADTIRPNYPVGWKDGDTISDIVSVVLDSWGISFSGNGSGSLREDTQSLLNQFYSDQNYLASEFWATAQIGVNKLGQLILDHTTVGRIIQFAQWLITEYSLTDNYTGNIGAISIPSSAVAIPYYSGTDANGVIRNGKIQYVTRLTNSSFPWYTTTTYSTSPVYYVWIAPNYPQLSGAGTGRALFTLANSGQQAITITASDSNSKWTGTYNMTQRRGAFYYNFWTWDNTADYVSYGGYNSAFLYFRSLDEFYAFLDGASTMAVTTTTIDIPTVAPEDGLLVTIPEAQWGDSLFDILDLIERLIVLYDNTQLEVISIVETLENLLDGLQTEVSVNNIPGGVILDYDDYDIPLENDWGLFDIFFNTGGDEISLLRPWQELRSIIYGFPAPVLSFFALVILFIVAYGFIRMGRDSH